MKELVIKKPRKKAVKSVQITEPEVVIQLPTVDATELSGTWHKSRDYSIKYKVGEGKPHQYETIIFISVKGVITGCGLVQLHGISNITDANFEAVKKEFERIKADYKLDGAGCIMCTLGAGYYPKQKYLFELGFVLVSEYANYRHGQDGKYKQRMYLLTY
jgi:hypothetical protein